MDNQEVSSVDGSSSNDNRVASEDSSIMDDLVAFEALSVTSSYDQVSSSNAGSSDIDHVVDLSSDGDLTRDNHGIPGNHQTSNLMVTAPMVTQVNQSMTAEESQSMEEGK